MHGPLIAICGRRFKVRNVAVEMTMLQWFLIVIPAKAGTHFD
jgi:hypothetical protein